MSRFKFRSTGSPSLPAITMVALVTAASLSAAAWIALISAR